MAAPALLPVYAAPVEGDALAAQGARRLGVGKTAAAAALTAMLAREPRPAAVLLFGVAGAYPARHRPGARLRVGDLCLVGDDRFGDEGVLTATHFDGLAALGLGDSGPFPAEKKTTEAAAERLRAPIVSGCTVSTCSGTDALSQMMAARTGAEIETMEGAAVAFVCRQFIVPLVQLRCISNFTGERAAGGWDLAGAVARVQAAVATLLGR